MPSSCTRASRRTEWQVQVESTQPVQAVVLATTVKETA
jgi:hypothetical protein